MTVSVFFNNFDSFSEQKLIEDLIIESIRIYGFDVFYCPREIKAKNPIFNEDALSEYNRQFLIEMYIKNVEGFEGEGDFLSKFNLQIRDEITFTVARRVFSQEIANEIPIIRPNEGDLIFFPLTNKVYVIKFVEHESVFYQMGGLQTYDLRCELFEYSNEKLNTGIPNIDRLEKEFSTNVGQNNYAQLDANGNIIINEFTGRPEGLSNNYNLSTDPFAENSTFESNAKDFIDFSEMDPFSEGEY
jgi:hypothetical protein